MRRFTPQSQRKFIRMVGLIGKTIASYKLIDLVALEERPSQRGLNYVFEVECIDCGRSYQIKNIEKIEQGSKCRVCGKQRINN